MEENCGGDQGLNCAVESRRERESLFLLIILLVDIHLSPWV
jgi:hypothetical protein